MDGQLKEYMRVGLIHFMVFPEVIRGEGPVTETLQKILDDDFFNAVEITQVKDPAAKEEAKKMLEQSGFAVGFGGQPMLLIGKHNLNSEDEAARDQAVRVSYEAVDNAVDFNASGCGILSGKDPGKAKRENAKVLLLDSLTKICAYAKEKGSTVLLEQFDRVEYGKNCLIGPIVEAVEISQELRRNFDNFGLMIDLSHMPLLDEKPADIMQAAEHIGHVHIGNCVKHSADHPAYGDEHPVFGIAEGENSVDELRDYLAMLMDIGYIGKGLDNIVSFEIKPFGDQTADEIIEVSKETLQAAWDKL
jgi:sugar phosphate isomerase/epimerase